MRKLTFLAAMLAVLGLMLISGAKATAAANNLGEVAWCDKGDDGDDSSRTPECKGDEDEGDDSGLVAWCDKGDDGDGGS